MATKYVWSGIDPRHIEGIAEQRAIEEARAVIGVPGLPEQAYLNAARAELLGSSYVPNRATINVQDAPYNAKCDGVTDDTAAFLAAAMAANAVGGGVVGFNGTAVISNFSFGSMSNVIVEGSAQGYSYGDAKTAGNLKVVAGTWGVRFPVTSFYCGLRNLGLSSTGALAAAAPHAVVADGVEYGVIIEVDNTTMEDVTVHGFQHGCVAANDCDSNIFERCSFEFNTRTGFACTTSSAAAYAAYHPNLVAPTPLISNTLFTLRNCNFRRNGWGIILRDGQAIFDGACVIESNYFGGICEYVGTLDSGITATWRSAYCENNWSSYDTTVAYTITQNNLLKETANTWMPFTLNAANNALNDAGYQILMGSITSGVNQGPSRQAFYELAIVASGTQKAMYLKSAWLTKFYNGQGIGGDSANAVRLGDGATFLASETHFYDWNGTLPTVLGNRGMQVASESSADSGGLTAGVGHFRGLFGPVNFSTTVALPADGRTLYDYAGKAGVTDWTPIDASGASLAFSSAVGTYTKIGRQVTIVGAVTYPVTANGANAVIGGLPFTVPAGNLSRQSFISYSDHATIRYLLPAPSATTATPYTAAGGAITNAGLSGLTIFFTIIIQVDPTAM